MKKTGVVIMARSGATRCPGKVLRVLGGRPVVQWVIEAAQAAALVDHVVLAAPRHDARLEEFERLAHAAGVDLWLRPNEDDVLRDFYQAAQGHDYDPVVRVFSDSPFTSPGVIDACIALYRTGCDYCTNAPNFQDREFPRGLDTEVFSFAVLEWMHRNLTPERPPYGGYTPDYREHVTLYIREHPGLFKTKLLRVELNQTRLCIDTEDDWEKLSGLVGMLGGEPTWWDAMRVLEAHPELAIREGRERQPSGEVDKEE